MLHRSKALLKKINNRRAVTMIELLIVIAVIGVALVPASTALVTGMNIFTNESEDMERVYEAQNAIDYITDSVRFNAHETISIVHKTIDTTEGDVLIIEESSTTEIRTIYYDATDNSIKELTTNSDDPDVKKTKTILKNVISLNFDNIILIGESDDEKLSRFDVAIELEKREYGQETFETTIYLRNN